MKRLIFRKSASTDLRTIAKTTRARWGDEQAAIYIAQLRNGIMSLREFDHRFPLHEDSHRGLRKMRSGHHFVFYLVSGETIEVVRVLHERMDAGNKLKE